MISRDPMDDGIPVDEETLEYYRQLAANAETIRPLGEPEHVVTFICDAAGFEAMFVDGELVADSYTLKAHEVVALLAERLNLPWRVSYGHDPDSG